MLCNIPARFVPAHVYLLSVKTLDEFGAEESGVQPTPVYLQRHGEDVFQTQENRQQCIQCIIMENIHLYCIYLSLQIDT